VTDRHDLAATLPWMRAGTDYLLAHLGRLTNEELRAPSRLPGWTRAHVVAHIARNAEALTRLATWARTGVETPMYGSRGQRAREIEETARRPADILRAEIPDTAAALERALHAVTNWEYPVRSALGRAIPVTEVPWMRIREVWLHAVDLGTGATVSDFPVGVVNLLLDDVTAGLSAKPDCPSVSLVPTDRDRTWQLRPSDDTATTVEAAAADLAGWLTGRADAPDQPRVPAWL
jgi:maleylpyruvate isomerase